VGVSLAVGTLVGNENGYADALVREGSTLLTMKFSRDHERVADDLAWELLRKAQVNPKGMVDFFVTLANESGVGPQSSLLSTHPAPQERVDRLRQKMTSLDTVEYTSFIVDFQSLQTGLRSTLPSSR
jgi:predicted Zn-dependent protease